MAWIDNSLVFNPNSVQYKSIEEFEKSFAFFTKNIVKQIKKYEESDNIHIEEYDYNRLKQSNLFCELDQINQEIRILLLKFFTNMNKVESKMLKEEYEESQLSLSERHCIEGNNNQLLSLRHNEKYKVHQLCIGEHTIDNIYDLNSFRINYKKRLLWLIDSKLRTKGKRCIEFVCIEEEQELKIVCHRNFSAEYNKVKSMQSKVCDVFSKILLGDEQFDFSSLKDESDAVKNNDSLRNLRKVKFDEEDILVFKHMKMSSSIRLYLKKEHNKIYVGKLTEHLPTKKY